MDQNPETPRDINTTPHETVETVLNSAASILEPENILRPDRPERGFLTKQTLVDLGENSYHARLTFHKVEEVDSLVVTLQLLDTSEGSEQAGFVMGVEGDNVYGFSNFTDQDLREQASSILESINTAEGESVDLEEAFFQSAEKVLAKENLSEVVDPDEIEKLLEAADKVAEGPADHFSDSMKTLIDRDFSDTRVGENPVDSRVYTLNDGTEIMIGVARDEHLVPRIAIVNRITTQDGERRLSPSQFLHFDSYETPLEPKYGPIPENLTREEEKGLIEALISDPEVDPVITQIVALVPILSPGPPRRPDQNIQDYYAEQIMANKEVRDMFIDVARESKISRTISGSTGFNPLQLPEFLMVTAGLEEIVGS